MPVWFKIAIGGHMALLVGMGLGRFSYTPMVPALTGAGVLSAPEAGAVGAVNLGAYVVGGLASGWLARRSNIIYSQIVVTVAGRGQADIASAL